MENEMIKKCPFRVCKVEHPAMLRGHGATVTEEFYNCMGTACAAYYQGGCLRLLPPALTVDTDRFTEADLDEFLEAIRNAPLMATSGEEHSIVSFDSCATCGNKATNACDACVTDIRRARPSGWIPKEVQR